MRHAEGRLKAELQTIIGCFLAVSAVCACVARPLAAQGTTAAQAEPLTLTPENTVILDRSVYAGRFLQFYLIKFFVGEKEAAPYAVNEKSDRAGSRHFPLIAEDGKKPIPDGRNVIAVGDTRFLPPEERERLASSPGAILLRRTGNAVVVAGSPFNDGWGAPMKAMATFLERVAGIGKPPYAQYVINALGAFRGFGEAKDNREGVRVAVKLDKANGLYTLEAALPLKAKGYDCTAEKALSFNVARNVFTRDSYSPEVTLGWYPIFYTPTRPESRGLAVVQSDGKAE